MAIKGDGEARRSPRMRFVRRFARDTRGGFATMLAVSAVPLIFAAGVGVDVSRMLTARNDLQAAADNAALALARQPYATQTPPVLQSQADAWVRANFARSDASTPVVSPTADATQVVVAASTDVTTTLGALMQLPKMHVAVSSTVKRALKKVELALVLDNTGSMTESDGSGSTKSATLKSAATTLIDALSASATASGQADAFKVAMVPFATYVNIKNVASGVDPQQPATWPAWMPGTSDYALTAYGFADIFPATTNRFGLLQSAKLSWGGCVESRPMPYDVTDAAPSASVPGTRFVPYFAPDEPDYIYYGGNGKALYTNNYIDDDAGIYNNNTLTTTSWLARQSDTSKYKPNKARAAPDNVWGVVTTDDWGPNADCANVYVQALTTDYGSVKQAIQALSPAGNTHIPFGLAWGWYMLSPNMPFSGATAYNTPNTYKIAVLVTDGANTYNTGLNYYCNTYYGPTTNQVASTTNSCAPNPNGDNSSYTGYGYVWQKRIAKDGAAVGDVGKGDTSDPAGSMNDRLVRLCRNMQAAGVILYTVPLRVTDAPTKAMLQACASPANVGPTGTKYLEAQSGSDLKQAFANIAGQISALRVSQ